MTNFEMIRVSRYDLGADTTVYAWCDGHAEEQELTGPTRSLDELLRAAQTHMAEAHSVSSMVMVGGELDGGPVADVRLMVNHLLVDVCKCSMPARPHWSMQGVADALRRNPTDADSITLELGSAAGAVAYGVTMDRLAKARALTGAALAEIDEGAPSALLVARMRELHELLSGALVDQLDPPADPNGRGHGAGGRKWHEPGGCSGAPFSNAPHWHDMK